MNLKKRLFLKNIHLVDYKSIKDLSVELKDDLNIIIGKNGAGKSNFLEAIREAVFYTGFKPFTIGSADVSFKSFDDRPLYLELRRSNASIKDIEEVNVSQKLYLEGKLAYDNINPEMQTLNLGYLPNLRTAFSKLKFNYWSSPLLIGFELPEKLEVLKEPGAISIPINREGTPWDIVDSTDFVQDIIFDLMQNEELREIPNDDITRAFLLKHLIVDEKVKNNLRKFTPIQDIKFNGNINIYSDEKHTIVENLKLDFLIDDNWLPWSHLSDGTKRLFYIVSEVTANEGSLILIEEPELGVHPHQFDLLMTFLKEQSKYSQIIMSTHSPKALDHLSEEELDHILIAEYTKANGTQFRRMSVEQEEKAKVYMKDVGYLSDYWLMSDLEE